MTEYLTTNLIVDEDFSFYDDWDENSLTFTHNGVDYKVGVNAFTDYNEAVQAKAAGDASLVIGCPVSEMGCYDDGTPATWDGTITITTADTAPSEQSVWCIDGNLCIDGQADIAFGLMSQEGAFHITNNSVVTMTYHLGAAYNTFTNLTIDNGARLQDEGRLGAGFTFAGTTAVTGEQTTAGVFDAALSLTSVKESILAADGDMTLSQGASAKFGQFTLAQDSSLVLNAAQFVVTKTLNMKAGSSITLDASSQLQVKGKTKNLGTITVDAAGFVGYKKIIDLAGVTNPGNAVQVVNAASNLTVLTLDDGDVVLTTADMGTLKVNGTWAGAYEIGDAIDPSGDFIYGVNAFASLDDAYAIATDRTPKQVLTLDAGNSTMGVSNTLTDIVVKDTANLEITAAVDFGKPSPDAAQFTVEAGGTLSGDSARLTLHGNSTLNLDGEADKAAVVHMTDGAGHAGDIILTDAATLDASYADMAFGTLALETTDTSATFANSDAELATALQIGMGAPTPETPTVSLDASTIAVNCMDESYNYGTLALANNSALELTFDGSDETAFSNYGTMELAGDSSLTSGKDLLNNGDISLNHSVLTVEGTTTNNGSITALDSTMTSKGLFTNSGTASFENSTLNANNQLDNQSSFTLISSDAAIGQLQNTSGSFTATDSTLTVQQSIDNDATLSLTRTDTTISLDLINDATFTSVDSQLSVIRNLINNGSFTASGDELAVGNNLTNTGTLKLSEETATITGNFTSTAGKVTLDDTTLTVNGNFSCTAGKATFTDSTVTVNGSLSTAGTLTVDNSAMTVAGTFTNSGKLYLDYQNVLSAGAFEGSGGSIVFDLSEETEDAVKLIDLTSPGSVYLEDFGNVTLNNSKYSLLVYDNDLYAYNLSTIKVNSTWTADTVLPVGCFWGINAFKDINNASREIGGGSITYEFTYSNKEGCDAIGTFTITPNSGTPTVTYKYGDTVLASYAVTAEKQQNINLVSGETYTIEFEGDDTTYSIAASFMGNSSNPKEDLDFTTTDSGTAGYGIPVEYYYLTVAEGTSGDYSFTVNGMSKRVAVKVVNLDTSKNLISTSNTSSVSRQLSLTAGNYALTVVAYDNSSHNYDTDYDITISGVVNSDVWSKDDNIKYIDPDGDLQTLSFAHNVDGFIGLGDQQDYIHLDIGQETGKYNFYLETEENTDAKGMSVCLYSYDGSTKTTVESHSYAGNQSDPIFENVLLDGTKTYFLYLHVASASTSSKNATYTLRLGKGEENLLISSDDDLWTDAAVQENPYEGGIIKDWVGTQDSVDWVKISAGTFTGEQSLVFTSEGGTRLAVTIYKDKGGTLTTLSSINAYSGAGDTPEDVLFESQYDYYVRMQCVAGSDVSTYYTMRVA